MTVNYNTTSGGLIETAKPREQNGTTVPLRIIWLHWLTSSLLKPEMNQYNALLFFM